MDSSRPSHLIEVLQAMKHFAVYAGNTRHTYRALAFPWQRIFTPYC